MSKKMKWSKKGEGGGLSFLTESKKNSFLMPPLSGACQLIIQIHLHNKYICVCYTRWYSICPQDPPVIHVVHKLHMDITRMNPDSLRTTECSNKGNTRRQYSVLDEALQTCRGSLTVTAVACNASPVENCHSMMELPGNFEMEPANNGICWHTLEPILSSSK